jgi:hypothetical protein
MNLTECNYLSIRFHYFYGILPPGFVKSGCDTRSSELISHCRYKRYYRLKADTPEQDILTTSWTH